MELQLVGWSSCNTFIIYDPWYDENELQRKIETINKQEHPPSNI